MKEINPEYSLEELMLKLKLQYFGTYEKNWLIRKDPVAGKDRRWEEKGMTEDEMVAWIHQLLEQEFELVPGVGDAAVHGVAKSWTWWSDWMDWILQHSSFFMVWLSLPYMTTGKTTTLTLQIFVSKLMSLLFNTMTRFVITFLPRNSVF